MQDRLWVCDVAVKDVPVKIQAEVAGREQTLKCSDGEVLWLDGRSRTTYGVVAGSRNKDKGRLLSSHRLLWIVGSRAWKIVGYWTSVA